MAHDPAKCKGELKKMTTPMDPNELGEPGASEYSWGKGMFPPGVANNEGQSQLQDDFGKDYSGIGLAADGQTLKDNWARAAADRRTDPTDPASGRDFESYGNPDRFGAGDKLVREGTQPDSPGEYPVGPAPLQRKKSNYGN